MQGLGVNSLGFGSVSRFRVLEVGLYILWHGRLDFEVWGVERRGYRVPEALLHRYFCILLYSNPLTPNV